MKTFKQLFILSCLILTHTAEAKIIRKPALEMDNVDLQVTEELFIARTYSSRSFHDGLFGVGWCSDLEKRLLIKDLKVMAYFDCRFSEAIDLKRLSLDKNLKESFGTLLQDAQNFVHVWPTGHKEYFDLQGRLTKIETPQRQWIALSYSGNDQVPKKINFSSNVEVSILSNEAIGKITSLTMKDHERVYFTYKNHHLMKSERQQVDPSVRSPNNISNESFEYEYDDYSNLIKMTNSARQIKTFLYDLKTDELLTEQTQLM